jgi:hypothetical protein
MHPSSFRYWWICLPALGVTAFLILSPARHGEDAPTPASSLSLEAIRKPASTALPADDSTQTEIARPAEASSNAQQAPGNNETDASHNPMPPASPSLEIGPDQSVPAAFASFDKDFTPQDISVAQQLRQAFYDAVGSLSSKDPDYAAKWNAAQKENDDLYRLYYGKDRFMTQHRKAYVESFADGGSQQQTH